MTPDELARHRADDDGMAHPDSHVRNWQALERARHNPPDPTSPVSAALLRERLGLRAGFSRAIVKTRRRIRP